MASWASPNIHQANAIKNLNSMFINALAAAIFIYKGLVDWPTALLMAVGATFGGYAGAGTARRLGQKNVRRLVILIGLSLAVAMLFETQFVAVGWAEFASPTIT